MINRLKSLDLQGYKTFASRTLFEFPARITAIVGPNGSGKSNIADAIRWVLGEQAFTLLRGKKTLDMIFSGSEQRPRSSMASVTIAFDNQSGWLPIDFSEVAITRRAYRNGENEYLLNNQKVRLKEINELLANSGLGERTYTIIGQGLVDLALSLRPEERRRFFEEAAGIGLYRSRREEAVQKLDKTQRNMERVMDIMGELSPRLKSLEKSREKALLYKQIQDDLFMLLRDWYGYYWHAAVKELNVASEFYKQQKEKFQIKQAEKEKIEEQLNQTQQNISKNRNQLASLHQKLSQCHQMKEEMTRELAVLEEREKTLNNRVQEAAHSLQILAIEKENDQQKLVSLKEENKSLLKNYQTAKQQLSAAELETREKNQKLAEINEKISEIRKTILSSESSILGLEADIKNRQNDVQSANAELIVGKEFIEKSMAECSKYKERIKELNQEIALKGSEIDHAEEAISNSTTLLNELRVRIEKITIEIQNLDLDKSRLATELAMILDEEANLSGFSSGSSEIIQAARDGRLKGKYAPVLQYLEVPEPYEVCISAALGDILEGVITEEISNADELIDFINRNNINRTAIVHGISGDGLIDPEKKRKSNLLALELIHADNHFAERIKHLLARTIVVDDHATAARMAGDLKVGWRIVTLGGEVFEADGVIIAGRPKGLKPIKRKREKEKVSALLESIEKERYELQKTLDSLKEEIQIGEKRLQEQNQKLMDAQSGMQQLLLDKHKQQIELSQLEKVINQEEARVDDIENNLTILKQLLPTSEEKIKAMREKIADLEKEEAELTSAVASIHVDQKRVEIIELNSRKAVAEELLNQHGEKIRIQKERIENVAQEINESEKNYQELISEHKNVRSAITDLRQKSELINNKIEELNQAISPLEKQVEAVIGQQGNLLDEVEEARQDYSIAERHMLQAQMKVEKLRDNLDHMRSKIEEDFGMIMGETDKEMVASQPLPFRELLTNLPVIKELPDDFGDLIKQKKAFLRRMGPINPDAEREYNEVSERVGFLQEQLQDLEQAERDLRKVVAELDNLMQTEFMRTFQQVDKEFQVIFSQLFNGGTAKIYAEDPDNSLDSGIEIEATLPGRRKQELALLSGGERSLTAVALIFALLKISPPPFCVLDEVDAMLDESNVVRFGELLRDLSDSTQFIVITHNRNTVQLADVLYGVTMGKDSASQVISLKLDELTEELVQ